MKKKVWLLILMILNFGVRAQPFQKTMKRLPDSGQINSYTTTFGEDNDYAINTPFFIQNGNGTITDTITGLIWKQADGGEMTFENAILYADTSTFAGYSDWRLPTPGEAFSILNLQKNNPALDVNYFTNSGAEYWWTSARQANDPNKIWCTNAGGGIGNHPKAETISSGGTKKFHARLVRKGLNPELLPNRFTDNGDGTLTDLSTGLIWMKNPISTSETWENALSLVENLNFAGYSDWRLPNIKELRSIQDETKINPCVSSLFSILGNEKYWSSTSLSNQAARAWYFHTQFGITTYDLKTVANKVLPVRGPVSLLTANSRNEKLEKTLLAWPNPFESKIKIHPDWKNKCLMLTDLLGKVVYSGREIENQDFIKLPQGHYFLRTEDGITQKLVHQ